MSLLQLYQKETDQGIFDTYKIILPDGTEILRDCDDQVMNIDSLDQYVGERIVLHIYNGPEHMVSTEVTLLPSTESPFGGKVPRYKYDEDGEFLDSDVSNDETVTDGDGCS